MDSPSSDARSRSRGTDEFGTTRRMVLAAGGAVVLGGLAGCAAVDGLVDRAGEQVVGTTVAAPAAFYPGRPQAVESAGSVSAQGGGDATQVVRTGSGTVRTVPATIRAESREIELEGWSTSGVTTSQGYRGDNTPIIKGSARAQDYNSSRSNKYEWWAGPDDIHDDDSDDDGLLLEAIQRVELALLGHVTTAQAAVERRDQAAAKASLDAFINATTKALRPALDECEPGVCTTIRTNSDIRAEGVRRANDGVDDGDWTVAVKELAGVEEIVLGDIERLDDELVDRRPGRPRFIDIIRYMRDAPTIGERFTVCLPDATLPGDRGSVAEALTPGRLLANGLIDEVREDDKVEYGIGSGQGDDSCVDPDSSESILLHQDIACGRILSAELDMKATENRAMVGYSTEGGAVVTGAPASADTDGKCVFVAADGTLRDATSLDSWGRDRTTGDVSVSQTLVCPVTVTPADCPCPLPGLFFVRRIIHDEQLIFAGGWTLDEGALYEDSVTLLFDEGPTEVASITAEDIESGTLDDRMAEQFSRDRSQHGSAVVSAQVQGTDMNKAELIEEMASDAFQTDEGRKGLNAVNVKVLGEQGDDADSDDGPIHVSASALDAPLVHLAGAGTLSDQQKRELIVPVAMDKGLR